MHRPSTVTEAADMLADCGRAGTPVRPVGSGSRASWAAPEAGPVVAVSTGALTRVVEHNPGDFTAVLEAGVPLADAQDAFAGSGQWLAVDPAGPSGTIGGLIATADSGPCRHRYGGVRDLVIGITVVLSDGTVASSGGRVIKNVAGYDLAKLFTGSYGTLGLIASVAVRLHPRPPRTVTIEGTTSDPARLGHIAIEVARHPLEALSLDAYWDGDAGGLLIRFGGVAAVEQAERTRALLGGCETVRVVEDDDPLWGEQRSRQRSPDGAVLKVSGRPTDLPAVIAAARAAGARVASRAALGLSWLALPPGEDLADQIATARAALAPRSCMVLDGASRLPQPWPDEHAATLALMRRVKARFDPARIFRPGAYLGGI